MQRTKVKGDILDHFDSFPQASHENEGCPYYIQRTPTVAWGKEVHELELVQFQGQPTKGHPKKASLLPAASHQLRITWASVIDGLQRAASQGSHCNPFVTIRCQTENIAYLKLSLIEVKREIKYLKKNIKRTSPDALKMEEQKEELAQLMLELEGSEKQFQDLQNQSMELQEKRQMMMNRIVEMDSTLLALGEEMPTVKLSLDKSKEDTERCEELMRNREVETSSIIQRQKEENSSLKVSLETLQQDFQDQKKQWAAEKTDLLHVQAEAEEQLQSKHVQMEEQSSEHMRTTEQEEDKRAPKKKGLWKRFKKWFTGKIQRTNNI